MLLVAAFVAVAAVVAAVVVVPSARDALETRRTGFAPGSFAIARVAADGKRLVGVGGDFDRGELTYAAWEFTGGEWRSLGTPPGASHLSDVAVVGEDVVVVGAAEEAPAIWGQTAGGGWRVLHRVESARPEEWYGEFSAVAVGDGGTVVAVGFVLVAGVQAPLAVTSTAAEIGSGATWQDATVETTTGAMEAVAAGPDSFVAAGTVNSTDPGSEGARAKLTSVASFWRSTDGRTWTIEPVADAAAPDPNAPAIHRNSHGNGVAAGPGSAAAAVGIAGGVPAAWTRDASTGEWRRHDLPDAGPGQVLRGVRALPQGGYLAVGRENIGDDVQRPLAWMSRPQTPDEWVIVGVSGADFDGLSDTFETPAGVSVVGNDAVSKKVGPVIFDLRGSVLAERE